MPFTIACWLKLAYDACINACACYDGCLHIACRLHVLHVLHVLITLKGARITACAWCWSICMLHDKCAWSMFHCMSACFCMFLVCNLSLDGGDLNAKINEVVTSRLGKTSPGEFPFQQPSEPCVRVNNDGNFESENEFENEDEFPLRIVLQSCLFYPIRFLLAPLLAWLMPKCM